MADKSNASSNDAPPSPATTVKSTSSLASGTKKGSKTGVGSSTGTGSTTGGGAPSVGASNQEASLTSCAPNVAASGKCCTTCKDAQKCSCKEKDRKCQCCQSCSGGNPSACNCSPCTCCNPKK